MMKKIRIFLFILTIFITFSFNISADSDMDEYGNLIEFIMIDDLGEERNVQVFIPHNYDHEVPAKVLWYFRGANGVYITWNIETTRLYKTAYEEKVVIVAPDLFQRTWSRGEKETDYYLVKDIIEKIKTLKDSQDRLLNLDLKNMVAVGFSGGGGFIYHLGGHYPLIFNERIFKRLNAHAKHLDVTIHSDGTITGNKYDIQSVNDLKAAYAFFPEEKPPFLLSVGTLESGGAERMGKTRDTLLTIGFDATLYIVTGLNHRFFMDFSPEFKKRIKDFLFPLRMIKPDEGTEWRFNLVEQKEFEVKWSSELKNDKLINIDLFSHNDKRYFAAASSMSNAGSQMISLYSLPLKTGKYFVRIKTEDNMDIAYSQAFNIVLNPLSVSLQASRKIERSWIIFRHYGEINLSTANMESVPVSKFKIYRKESSGEYQVVKEIPVADLQSGGYTFFDKFLQNSVIYMYKAEAVDAAGIVLGTSGEKAI